MVRKRVLYATKEEVDKALKSNSSVGETSFLINKKHLGDYRSDEEYYQLIIGKKIKIG